MMPPATLYQRTLARACELVGGVDVLADRLSVQELRMHIWLKGLVTPDLQTFRKAVDVVVLHDGLRGFERLLTPRTQTGNR